MYTISSLISAASIIPKTCSTILPNLAVFDPSFNIHAYIDCWGNTLPFLRFFVVHHIYLWIQVPQHPPGEKHSSKHLHSHYHVADLNVIWIATYLSTLTERCLPGSLSWSLSLLPPRLSPFWLRRLASLTRLPLLRLDFSTSGVWIRIKEPENRSYRCDVVKWIPK